MTKDYEYSILMRDGSTVPMTLKEVREKFNLPARLAHGRIVKNGWRTEELLRMSPEAALKRNTRRMRRILTGECEALEQRAKIIKPLMKER